MKTLHRNLLVAAIVAITLPFAAGAADRTLRLMPASPADVTSESLAKVSLTVPGDLDRAPASFAWALDSAEALSPSKPFVQESREYWTNVTGTQLQSGVTVHATAPGAVIRLSPEAAGATKSLDPLNVMIRANGETFARGEAFANASNGAELEAAGSAFPEGTIAFKLRPEIGAGSFEIVVPKANGGFLLHVYEPESGERLSLTTDRANLVAGGALTVFVDYASASGKALGNVGGVIAAPNGKLTSLTFARGRDGRWSATARPDVLSGAGAGLWEVHTFATTSDGKVQRDAKTAFNAAAATARFDGNATLADAKAARGGMNVALGIDVSAASRYNVSGVLYATDARGQLVPAAIAHSATWLANGRNTLALQFGAELMGTRGLGAPYEIRELTLTNQGNLGVMDQRERALRIER